MYRACRGVARRVLRRSSTQAADRAWVVCRDVDPGDVAVVGALDPNRRRDRGDHGRVVVVVGDAVVGGGEYACNLEPSGGGRWGVGGASEFVQRRCPPRALVSRRLGDGVGDSAPQLAPVDGSGPCALALHGPAGGGAALGADSDVAVDRRRRQRAGHRRRSGGWLRRAHCGEVVPAPRGSESGSGVFSAVNFVTPAAARSASTIMVTRSSKVVAGVQPSTSRALVASPRR